MKTITKIDNGKIDISAKNRLRVAAYARVSTDNDDQLISLDTQRKHYERIIKNNPLWEFYGVYYDEGISGTKKENRAELMRLIKDCELRKIDLIITKSISRFARNTTDCLELVRKLKDLGVHIHFESENINTSDMNGELLLTILSSLAENESLSISQNNKWSIQKRFKSGTYKQSCAPFGYDLIDGNLVPNQEEAIIVKQIFAKALDGFGASMIVNWLNKQGILTRKKNIWHTTVILEILKNERYIGDALLGKTYTDSQFKRRTNYGDSQQYYIENAHTALISREDFEAVSKMLERRARDKNIQKANNKYQQRYAFSGKIICCECGDKFKRRIHAKNREQKYVAWCCNTHIAEKDKCSMLYISEDKITTAFATMMNKLTIARKEVIKPFAESLRSNTQNNLTLEVSEIETQIEKNQEQSYTLTNLLTSGSIDSAFFNKESNLLQAKLTILREKRNALLFETSQEQSALTEAEKLLKHLDKNKICTTFAENIFNEFVNSIIVFSPTEIGFKLKCGLCLKERFDR